LVGSEGDDILNVANVAILTTLTGGNGADQFILGSDAGAAVFITDFNSAEDSIALNGMREDYFSVTTGAAPAQQTEIYFDTNGDGVGDKLIATLDKVANFDMNNATFNA
jgi:Ca2+-binding RTX toxin-like protein